MTVTAAKWSKTAITRYERRLVLSGYALEKLNIEESHDLFEDREETSEEVSL